MVVGETGKASVVLNTESEWREVASVTTEVVLAKPPEKGLDRGPPSEVASEERQLGEECRAA